MTEETDQVEYVDAIVDLMIRVNEDSARAIAIDCWQYYPVETMTFLRSLNDTRDMKKVPRLFMKG